MRSAIGCKATSLAKNSQTHGFHSALKMLRLAYYRLLLRLFKLSGGVNKKYLYSFA